MTQEEIIEGNKLIAEFMYPHRDKRRKDYPFPFPVIEIVPAEDIIGYGKVSEGEIKHHSGIPNMMKYHSSWDWLMPVVEKIENMGFWFNIKKNHVTIAWDNKGNHDSNMIHSEFGDFTKIERVWSCIVAFIKYHNERNK